MSKLNLKYGLVALAGLGLSANVSATDLTCNDITFTPAAFDAYEFIDKACQEVVDRNGVQYAKLDAKIDTQLAGVTYVRIKHSDGTTGPRHKANFPGSFETIIDGRPMKLRDLPAGQEVRVYIGPEFWVSNLAVEEAVVEAIVEEAVEEAVVEEMVEEEMIEEEMVAELPTTAGPLPWLALFGSLFLLIGGALRFSRKQ